MSQEFHFPIEPSLLRVAQPLLPRPAGSSQATAPSTLSQLDNSSQYSSQSGSKRWTNEGIELLIDWFGSDLRNLELYKTKAKDALSKISKEVFDGKRSARAIKGK
ncbi:uncharacterized protein LAJ45_01520 [Morchella importuna]|uniref:uncharacterized protein n=1 Tax=Morchella importuna TaxID=1174673 RepID=UPI001E8DF55F|nr:uncharacterized protein LAJ45_01520 [Morchella importuna]KAH8154987.1 hypothetical protein LAJ45_01520 [Morchella importuna]